jgi:hypothetical protein
MWSNSRFFVGQNVEVNELVSTEDVVRGLKGQASPMSRYFLEGRALPELIVVFVEPELRTEQFPLLANSYAAQPNGGAFSKLKGTLESYAASSVVIPYSHSAFGQSVASMAAGFGGNVIVAKNEGSSALSELEGHKTITLQRLLELGSSKNWEVLSNGVPDVVIVGFESPVVHPENVEVVSASYSNDDAFMNMFLHSLGTKSYVALFTSDKAVTESAKKARAELSMEQLGASSDDSIFPPEVIEALIVMIPFLLILYIGVSCTSGVQSVLKFDAEMEKKK